MSTRLTKEICRCEAKTRFGLQLRPSLCRHSIEEGKYPRNRTDHGRIALVQSKTRAVQRRITLNLKIFPHPGFCGNLTLLGSPRNPELKPIAPPARLFGLDTLRAFAVLIVMLYHLTIFEELPAQILPVTYFGWMGVDLFFVLSGFLIGQQAFKPYLTGRRLALWGFYRRRAYRILPAYLVVVALYFLVPVWREAPRRAPLWKFVTFTMNFGFTFDRRAFLVQDYPDDIWTRIYYPSYTRLDGLVSGVSLALIRTFRPTWCHRLMQRGHTLFIAGLCCVGTVIWMFRDWNLGDSTGSAMWGSSSASRFSHSASDSSRHRASALTACSSASGSPHLRHSPDIPQPL